MNNRLIIALFILFALIIFFSSLQTVTHTLSSNSKSVPPTNLQATISPVLSAGPTFLPTATQIPPQIQHPGYRVNVGGEGGGGGDD